jgi:hypothetical protein
MKRSGLELRIGPRANLDVATDNIQPVLFELSRTNVWPGLVAECGYIVCMTMCQ